MTREELDRSAELSALRNDVIFWKGVSVVLLLVSIALTAYIFLHRR